jgi:predicted ATPase
MNLYLDNIGKICDSTIIVDGLTVITGENNSGKTTVGKTLYSIVSAVENLQQNAFIDKRNFARKTIRQLLDSIELRRYSRRESSEFDKSVNITDIDSIFDINIFRQVKSIEDILSVIDDKIKKINNCLEKDIHEFLEEKKENTVRNQTRKKRLVDNFIKKRTEVIKLLEEVKKNIKADSELTEYANAKIIKTLKLEFYDQIKGVNNKFKESKIRLYHKNEEYYNIELFDNELSSKDEIFLLQSFDSSLFVDDVFVVDDMADRVSWELPNSFYDLYEDEVFFNRPLHKRHKEKLLDKLLKNNNLFEENLYKEKTEKIIKCMKSANPGQMAIVKGKNVKYVIDGLDIRNLAMGSKMILIIKTLIEKGHCGSKTLLVLDEPEIHLHPEWQNILAETIVLLVKHLKTKVILTTHSPNFLLAIDVFTKIHKMQKLTHFYKSTSIDKYKVKIEIADENTNEIYAEITKPFIELDAKIDTIEGNDEGE